MGKPWKIMGKPMEIHGGNDEKIMGTSSINMISIDFRCQGKSWEDLDHQPWLKPTNKLDHQPWLNPQIS